MRPGRGHRKSQSLALSPAGETGGAGLSVEPFARGRNRNRNRDRKRLELDSDGDADPETDGMGARFGDASPGS